ncbi:MAG: T9SS type A sorting domain-containing protein, partial [Flavobacteriales bacterium]
TNSLSLTSLNSGFTHKWRVHSVCDSMGTTLSAWSTMNTFVTTTPPPSGPIACTVPVNLSETNVTSNSSTLNWDAIPGSWGYKVMHRQVGFGWVYTIVNTNSLSLTSLNAGSTHKWRVHGVCDSLGTNLSSWSAMQIYSTLSSIRIITGNNKLADNLNIYPNPTRGLFNISFVSEEVNNFEIMLVDAFGKVIMKENKQQFIGEYTKQVDLSTYSKGIYMVKIRTNDSFVSKRILVQ